MHYTPLVMLYWALGSAVSFALFLALTLRGRWRQFPVLTAWFAFLTVRAILLFAAYLDGSTLWYTRIWMAGLSIDFVLQLWIVLEIARIVLRPTGTWVRDARGYFFAAGLTGIAVAAFLTWYVSPMAASPRRVWEIRSNLFTSLVICELFVVMSMTANRLGLGWRNHVMAVGQTLTVWSAVMVIKTAIQSFPATQHFYGQLDQIRQVTYAVTTCWLILQLWRDEPERKPISPELSEYILALHRRVEYDLRRLDAPQ
jgi:hypothetical protein